MKESCSVMLPRQHPRLIMTAVGPFVGAITGLIAGIFGLIVGKSMNKKELEAQE